MRIDKYLVEKGYFSSRARAKEAILSGSVVYRGTMVLSPDKEVMEGDPLTVTVSFPWVSRGALKLLAGLEHFHIDPKGIEALDLGASTGGFTQVLLSRGAKKVYAVDIGHGQLHSSLVADPRVVSWEGTDVRTLKPEQFSAPFPLIVGDLSFISLVHIFPILPSLMEKNGKAIFLMKPQFEVGKGNTKKGIVKNPVLRLSALNRLRTLAEKLGFAVTEPFLSPIEGGSGNTEYLLLLERGKLSGMFGR